MAEPVYVCGICHATEVWKNGHCQQCERAFRVGRRFELASVVAWLLTPNNNGKAHCRTLAKELERGDHISDTTDAKWAK